MNKKIFLTAFILSFALFTVTGCVYGNNQEQIVKGEKRLDLSNKGLAKLPDEVLGMAGLQELDISNNKFTGALPAEIRHLKDLRVLDASGNQMTGVPAEIGQLEKIEVLDLSDNKITGLPYELGNLKKLKTLKLSGNDYSRQDLEKIRKSLPGLVVE